MPNTPEQQLEPLNQLLGTWTTEARHPALPGVVVRGSAVVEWLEGERFLIHRARNEHPDFPDSISIIGFTDRDRIDQTPGAKAEATSPAAMTLHYFDSRGVFRVYASNIDAQAWRIWRDAPGFSQRFTGTVIEAGNTVIGRWQVCEDDVHWNDDLTITYRRQR